MHKTTSKKTEGPQAKAASRPKMKRFPNNDGLKAVTPAGKVEETGTGNRRGNPSLS